MINSYFEEIVLMASATGPDMHHRLVDIGIAHIFDYPWNKHQDSGNFVKIVLYTAYTYSAESRMLRLGADWQATKIRVAQKVDLPQYLYDDIVHLKDQIMADCFQDFLYLYQENMDYIRLQTLRELYQQVMSQSSRYNPDEDGNNDLKGKIKNIKEANELADDIESQEAKILAKYRILNAPKSEFKFDHTEHGNPLKLENSKHIR